MGFNIKDNFYLFMRRTVKVYQEDIIPMTINIPSINYVSNNLKLFGHRIYELLHQKKKKNFSQNSCIDVSRNEKCWGDKHLEEFP